MINNIQSKTSPNIVTEKNSIINDAEFTSTVPMNVEQNQSISKEMEHGEEKERNLQEEKLKFSVDKLNKFLQGESTHIQYERHDKLKNQFVVKIIDNKTKEVIKEIPPKKILDMVAELCKLAGIIVDKKA